MDLEDFLAMEDESAIRLEDEMINACPNCGSQMDDKYNCNYGDYKHCDSCGKNWKSTPIFTIRFQ